MVYAEDKVLYIVQGFTVLASLIDISWYYAGVEKFKIMAIRNIFVKIFSVILIFVFVKSRDDLVLYAIIVSLSLFLGQAFLWTGIKKEVVYAGSDQPAEYKHGAPYRADR